MTKLSSLLSHLRAPRPARPPEFEGFVHARTIHHVAGWARYRAKPGERVTVEAVLTSSEGERVLARGVADVYCGTLALQSGDDVRHGFQLYFDPPLSTAERDIVIVRPAGVATPLEFAEPPAPPPGTGPKPVQRSAVRGYIDELSLTRVSGWMMNRREPVRPLEFEVVIALPGETRVIARGVADQPYFLPQKSGAEATHCGFAAEFPAPLKLHERDNLIVRATGDDTPLARAPEFQGVVDELSPRHVAGWVRSRFRPEAALEVEAVLAGPHGDAKLAASVADRFHPGLALGAPEDGCHGFRLDFEHELPSEQLAAVSVRLTTAKFIVPFALPPAASQAAPEYQGYVDEISEAHVTGWVWNPHDPQMRVAFEVALVLPEECHILATGTADQLYPALEQAALGDARYGFHIALPKPIAACQRDHLVVRPALTKIPLERAPKFEGFVDELSQGHAAGWVRNRFDPEDRVAFEVVLTDADNAERILASGHASLLNSALAMQSIGDGRYGFRVVFDPPLSARERDAVTVRAEGTTQLPMSPYLVQAFEPIDHIALDIVNNCNLRCPFCLFDYAETRATRLMATETFDRVLPLLPYVRDGNFWLSCLHEPTLHPDFIGLIERVPQQWRRKIMFTTNLAKRMPESYFQRLSESGVSFINISLESLDPGIFERMRKGAKWPIFKENWDRLIAAWNAAAAPPRLRYIMMAYKSNLAEIPSLVKYLRAERLPWQVEVRHTYNALHIAADFRQTEFLDDADWAWLADQFAAYSVDEVMLILPPEFGVNTSPAPEAVMADAAADFSVHPFGAETPQPPGTALAPVAGRVMAEPAERRLTQPFNLQIAWDGKLVVYAKWENPPELKEFAVSNINDLSDPYEFLMSL